MIPSARIQDTITHVTTVEKAMPMRRAREMISAKRIPIGGRYLR